MSMLPPALDDRYLDPEVDVLDQRAEYSGDFVTIPANAILPMDSLDFGSALFDLTDPLNPAILAGGIYACTASIECNDLPLTDGGLRIVLHVDHADWDFVSEWTVPRTLTVGEFLISPSFTGYCPTGGIINVDVTNNDSAPHDLRLRELGIQRIT